MPPYHYWFELYPDKNKPIGGVKQVHRLLEALSSTNRRVTLVQEDRDFHPGWFTSSVTTISRLEWLSLDLDPEKDIVITPETFITPAYFSKAPHPDLRRIIFNQNSSYTFGDTLKSDPLQIQQILQYYHSDKCLSVICISKYDFSFLVDALNLPSSKVFYLPNPVDIDIFKPSVRKKFMASCMLRKNNPHIKIVRELVNTNPNLAALKIQYIHNQPQSIVASTLRDSLIFLDFGFPEGFGLPAAEAICSCCYLIGYDGLGGRELYSIAHNHQTGVSVEYGDYHGWIRAITELVNNIKSDKWFSSYTSRLKSASSDVRQFYSFNNLVEYLYSVMPSIENIASSR